MRSSKDDLKNEMSEGKDLVLKNVTYTETGLIRL